MKHMVRSHRLLALTLLLGLILAACGNQAGTGGAATGAPATSAPATAAPPAATVEATAGAPATAEATTEATTEATAEATTAATAGAATTAAGAGGTLRVGSKDFTEEFIVAEMYALLLEDAGFKVERKFNLAGAIAHESLVNSEIDLYPEYTSTGLQNYLKDNNRYTDPKQILETVRKGYEQQFKATWLDAAPFNDTNTFATTQAIADKYGIKTYSDLFAKAGELRLGGPAEFPERQDTKNLEQIYGASISNFKQFVQLGTGPLRYDALKNGDVDVIVAFTTDGRIQSDKLVVLEDDKKAYPIYQIAPVVRQEVLQANPQIADVLNKLAPLLTEEVMGGLNYQVDGEGKEYEEVARTFLEGSGVLTK